MLNRRGFLRLAAGAVAGMFAGKAKRAEAAQPEVPFTGKITNVTVHDHALSLTELWELFYQDPEDNIAPLVEALMAEKARPAKSQWIHVAGAETKLTDRLVTFWSGGQIVYPHIRPCWPMNDGRKGCA